MGVLQTNDFLLIIHGEIVLKSGPAWRVNPGLEPGQVKKNKERKNPV